MRVVVFGWVFVCFVSYHVLRCFLFQFASLVVFQAENKLTIKAMIPLPHSIFLSCANWKVPIRRTEWHNLAVATHTSLLASLSDTECPKLAIVCKAYYIPST